MAELDALGVAAMLAADADLGLAVGLAPALDRDSHQAADAVGIELREGVGLVDAALDIVAEELARVVAREPISHLREVVGAEGKELGHRADLAGLDAGARHLAHRADRICDARCVAARTPLGTPRVSRAPDTYH